MSKAMREIEEEFDKRIRDTLKDLLSQCTEKQQAFFLRMYPEGIDKMSESKIANAIDQCERTVIKNKQGGY